MSNWVKVFNSLPSHPKILRAGGSAGWLYVCGLCYANEHLTDGFIAREVLVAAAPGVKSPHRLARLLVENGLWHEVSGGWQIHDYSEVQRTSDHVKETRKADRERKMSGRNPSGVQLDSEREVRGIPSRAPSQEEKREEKNTPLAPGGGESEQGRLVAFRRRPVSDDVRVLAEAILADFNQQAGTNYGAYTGERRPSEDLKRILGAISDAAPPLTLAEASRIIRWRLQHPFWQGRPHTGVVFGPNVFSSNRESVRNPGAANPTSRQIGEALARATTNGDHAA